MSNKGELLLNTLHQKNTMTNTILAEFKNINNRFLHLLSSFTEEQFNIVPFEGSWTAAQVGDHVERSQFLVSGIMSSPTMPTQRDSQEKVETLKRIFLDFTTKLTSPEMILPSAEKMEKARIINNLTSIAGKVDEVINTVNLAEICTAFKLPNIGEMTGEEWAYFIIYHTQRHTHQLNNILQKVIAN